MLFPKSVPARLLLGLFTALLVVTGCRRDQPSNANGEIGANWKQVTVFIPELT
jgi:hypothetical protein